ILVSDLPPKGGSYASGEPDLPPEGGSYASGEPDLPPEGGNYRMASGSGSDETSTGDPVASAFRRKNRFGRKVTGILDFGDIVHSYAIADLAIAVAYAVLGKADPLAAAVSVVRGYQDVRPLNNDELASVFPLVL